MALSKGINWEEIYKEYTTTDATYVSLAEKHGIHFSTIQKKAKKQHWIKCGKNLPANTQEFALNVKSLGKRCSENSSDILNKIRNGWSIKQAFSSCGFDQSAAKRWLTSDTVFSDLIVAARANALGMAEEALYNSAVRRGSPDAALKILTNARETREDYVGDNNRGTVNVVVQIGTGSWNRDKPPISVEYEEVNG